MIPHRIQKRRDGAFAVVHPDTGEELGRFRPTGDGWRVMMPGGAGFVLLPETFPTRHEARTHILECHQPEEEP